VQPLRSYLLIILTFLITIDSLSQNFSGISSSNYAGIHAVLLNPANAADSRYSINLNLGAAGVELQNNYARWNAPYSLLSLMTRTVNQQYLSPTSGLPLWKSSYYKLNGNLDGFKAYINAEIRGPSFQISLPKKAIGIAVGVRYRVLNSFGNTSPSVGNAILSGTKNPLNQNIDFKDQSFLTNTGGYNEFFFSFGKVMKENDSKFFKIGATAKRLTSNLHLSLKGDAVDYRIEPTSNLNESQNVIIDKTQGTFYHGSSAGTPGISWLLEQMTDPKGIGSGFGADFGFVYEFRPDFSRQRYKYKGSYIPDPVKNKYLFKLGMALRDIGYLKFANPTEVEVGSINSTANFVAPATFYHINSTDELVGDIEQVYNLDRSLYKRSFTVLMPLNLVIHADYHYRDNIYISGVLHQYLLPKSRIGPIGYSGISIIPRIEKKQIEFAFPVSLENDYTNLNVGATMRLGPLFMGFDNITGVLNLGNPRGLAFHAGLSYGFNHKRPDNPMLKCGPMESKNSFSLKRLFQK
jgi:hypothetical protein